ncbi:MAG TPA: MoaF C-terminal domain-containing protein [Pseudolysinimonas sp.]|nr:MoaF C-terminal domain-containing protein [Pseudolysinimonas sp.]
MTPTPYSPAGTYEEWESLDDLPELDAFNAGQIEYRAPFTDDLAGTSLELVHADGRALTVEFISDHTLRRTFDGDGQSAAEVTYDATRVRDGIYLVDFLDPAWPIAEAVDVYTRNVTWALDLASGRVTIAQSGIVPVPHAAQGTLLRGRTEHESWNVRGTEGGIHPRSAGMAGHRVYWRYSKTDHYDHVYMNGSNFAWQCVSGIELGLTEHDRTRAYEVAPDLFFFHWTENQFVVESVLFVDLREMRTYGRMFGIDRKDGTTMHHQFGAYGHLLNKTVYPQPPYEN